MRSRDERAAESVTPMAPSLKQGAVRKACTEHEGDLRDIGGGKS